MSIDDYDEVYALWSGTEGVGLSESDARDAVASYLARNPGLSFVARIDNKVVGAVLCGHDGRRGYLHHLAVQHQHRRQGIGRTLVDMCLSKLASLEIHKCNIFLFSDNDDAKAFWKHNGWQAIDDLAVMQKIIEE